MNVLVVFLAGLAFGAWFVIGIYWLIQREARKLARRPGYIDFTHAKGGTASANPSFGDELSGGGESPPPPHLQLVKND